MSYKNILPIEALNQHVAILGKTGSGKTVTAKGIAELLMNEGKRICAIDPTGVWWGLKSSKDGNKAAFPVVVFGGDHADFPITDSHGDAVAEIVTSTDVSVIIDTSLMRTGERTRFFTEFSETLFRKNRTPLNLILDEADLFAPQGKIMSPQSGIMLHATNNLLARGRSRGLSVTMITQRPAKLHKDSLTQAETLIAMRLIAPQDRNAVKDWICEWTDPKEGAEMLSSLPSLKTGTGWIWAPEMEIFKKVSFPMIQTYDSSNALANVMNVVLASADLRAIETKLEEVHAEMVESDPKKLKARISELENKINNPASASVESLKDAEEKGYDIGFSDGHEAGYDLAIERLQNARGKYREEKQPEVRSSTEKPGKKFIQKSVSGDPIFDAALSVWPVKLSWSTLAAMCGRKARGGHFNSIRKRLIDEAFVREENGLVVLCNPPKETVGVIPADQLEISLPQPARKMFSAIRLMPGMDIKRLADNLEMKPTGGHWNSGMHVLRSNDLVIEDGGLRINPKLI